LITVLPVIVNDLDNLLDTFYRANRCTTEFKNLHELMVNECVRP